MDARARRSQIHSKSATMRGASVCRAASRSLTLDVAASRLARRCTPGSDADASLAQRLLAGGRAKHAAVLVPLFESDEAGGEVSVWLTRRSSTNVSTHKGEVSFPGGKSEPGESAQDTALREAGEECGLVSDKVIGCLRPVLSKHGLVVTPVVCTLPRGHRRPCPTSEEVDLVFQAPLRIFNSECASTTYRSEQYVHNDTPYTVHFFEYDDGTQTHVIWGLTAHILIEVAESALSAKPFFPKHLGRDRPRL